MVRLLASTSPFELRKWGAYALLLLAPGSFIVLPVVWLVRHFATGRPPGREVES